MYIYIHIERDPRPRARYKPFSLHLASAFFDNIFFAHRAHAGKDMPHRAPQSILCEACIKNAQPIDRSVKLTKASRLPA